VPFGYAREVFSCAAFASRLAPAGINPVLGGALKIFEVFLCRLRDDEGAERTGQGLMTPSRMARRVMPAMLVMPSLFFTLVT